MIAIVDYGMGNTGSILSMLRKAGAEAVVTRDADAVCRAEKLVLPGVGAFDEGMRRLREAGLVDLLRARVVDEGVPLLGICLGLQLLTRRSEEGTLPGLGWIEADTVRFRFPEGAPPLRVPHMGWNEVAPRGAPTPLLAGLESGARFYFVHSFHLRCDEPSDVAAVANYGYEFPCVVVKGRIGGTQFHPEKSHKFGLRLMANFARGFAS